MRFLSRPIKHSSQFRTVKASEWNADIEKTATVVTALVTAYPGYRDYVEKRSLLIDMELLVGFDIAKRTPHTVSNGLDTSNRCTEDTFEGSEETKNFEK